LGQQVVEREGASGASPPVHFVDGSVDKATQAGTHGCGSDAVGPGYHPYTGVREHLDGQLRKGLHGWELVRDQGTRDRFGRDDVGTDRLDELVGVLAKRRVEVTWSG